MEKKYRSIMKNFAVETVIRDKIDGNFKPRMPPGLNIFDGPNMSKA